jgi:lipid-A-disaccharide synthase-like uncharacterized protein
MEAFFSALFGEGRFLGIQWHFWKVIGWTGNVVFFSRFIIQWIATERKKQVVIPAAFWWLSLAGTLLLLAFSIHERNSVFIFSYCFAWIPYLRNLVVHRRHKSSLLDCPECSLVCPVGANFCPSCGTPLSPDAPSPKPTPSR